MRRTFRFLILSISLLFPLLNIAQEQSQTPKVVSFIELIANPVKFDGKIVFVSGFLGLDAPDGNMLYLHKEDYDNGILENAIGVEVSNQVWANREKLDLNYVSVVGVFRSGEKTHSRYNTITSVTNCVLKSNPSHPIRKKLEMPHRPPQKP